MKKLKKRLIKTFFTFTFLVASPSYGGEIPTFSIGVEPYHTPPYFNGENNEYTGFSREVLDAFAHSQNIKFKYVIHDIPQLNQLLVSERIDFKFPDNPLWAQHIKKESTIHYTTPISNYIDGTFTLKPLEGAQKKIRSLATLKGYSPKGHMKRITAGYIDYNETATINLLASWLLSKKVDAAYVNTASMYHELKNNFTSQEQDQIIWEKSLPYIEGHYLLSSVKHPNMIEKFNDWLKDNDALIQKLRKKHKIDFP